MPPIFPTATTVAAVGSHAAEIAGQTTSRTILGVTGTILTSVNNVRVNAKTARALSRRVNDMATAIATAMDDTADANLAQLDALNSFRDALLDMQAALEAQGQQGYLSQILHQQRDTDKLVDVAERISNLFSVLVVGMTLQTSAMTADLVSHMDAMAAADHESKFSMPPIGNVSEPAGAHIPPRPALYFGRGMETQAVVDVILGAPDGGRRVAVLGGPGMGKTTLTLSALHHPAVSERFGARRFFVPCDAAEGHSTGGCLPFIAKAFGVAGPDAKMVRHRLREVIGSEPLVLVLDNFESAWEAAEQRQDAEEALQFLDGMPDLALIITLRGTERPQGISWTRPFLPPLTSLADEAAKQTFVSIADVPDADSSMLTLLSHLDNVPLAVVLLANLAQYESTDVLLERWNAFQTSMLVRGRGLSHLTSLDVSITLSLRSPRMLAVPSAQTLLSLLSLLPAGAVDSDLLRWNVEGAQQALSVLLQTSLAIRRSGQRIHVLAPIRSFMLHHYPPSHADILPVYQHYFGLVGLTSGPVVNSTENAEMYAAVSAELANIESVIQYGLHHQPDDVDSEPSAVKAVVSLCILCHQTGMGSAADLLPRALSRARTAGSDALCADLLFYWALLSFTTSATSGDPKQLATEARELYQRAVNEAGILESSVFLTYFLPAESARAEAERLLVIAEQRQDRRTMARCLQQTAFALVRGGDLRAAIVTHERVLSILRQGTATDRLAGVSAYRIALLTSALGDLHGAAQRFEEALHLCEASGYAIGIAMCRSGLADTLMNIGQPLAAVEQAACVVNVTEVPSIQSYGRCLEVFVRANSLLGNMDAAASAMERLESLALSVNTGSLTRSEVLSARGFWLQACGDPEQARILFLAARATLRASHDPREFPENVLEAEACISLELGDTELSLDQQDSSVTAAVFAAVAFRSLDEQLKVIEALVLLAESVQDDACAERLLAAVMPVLRRMGLSHALAQAYLLSAEIASRRGKVELSRHRAADALNHFGDIEADWRLPRARALAANH
ncbi:hypothetical protein AURDEDRAFT_187416 [Auricularia subglabra TFB-10046 SS5]|nr:hypothetical protein AURDEDRAFT_187416 [Auricularia subglabra TFB-10046 SS5]